MRSRTDAGIRQIQLSAARADEFPEFAKLFGASAVFPMSVEGASLMRPTNARSGCLVSELLIRVPGAVASPIWWTSSV